ncbi:MAG: cytochrome c [Pyrinomonadaceae bacterium]|nr:cytochrome c [Pyrinomonadaceae bacterium]MCX7640774.1 cytochrome c [Pyrinomonadaceae bacterium]MDW8304669.1 cytochrome c [Acidobacteriota bacterium]
MKLTRSKLKWLFIAKAVALFVFACNTEKPKSRGIKISDAKTYEASLYRQNCAVCHGAEAYGKEIDGKMVPSLRFGDIEKRSEEEIFNQIAYGKNPMPSFKGQLTDEEIWRLVKFIRRDLQGKTN